MAGPYWSMPHSTIDCTASSSEGIPLFDTSGYSLLQDEYNLFMQPQHESNATNYDHMDYTITSSAGFGQPDPDPIFLPSFGIEYQKQECQPSEVREHTCNLPEGTLFNDCDHGGWEESYHQNSMMPMTQTNCRVSHEASKNRGAAESVPDLAIDKPHICRHQDCGKAYTRSYELTRHLRDKHGSKSRRLVCPVTLCPRSIAGNGFGRMDHLVKHLSGKHRYAKDVAAYKAAEANLKS